MKLIYWYKFELFSLHEYIEIICFELNKKENRKNELFGVILVHVGSWGVTPSQAMFHDIALASYQAAFIKKKFEFTIFEADR